MRRAALVALCVAGCSLTPPRVGERPPVEKEADKEKAYQAIVARYSAQEEIYATFDTRVLAGVTFQAWPFREARARRQAGFQALPEPTLQANLAREKAELDEAHEFFFAAHVNDYHFNDFDRASSVWHIALISSRGEVRPSKVERIGRSSLNMRAYYPYFDDFWDAYRVRFPKVVDGQPTVPETDPTITFRIASTLGKADFSVPAR